MSTPPKWTVTVILTIRGIEAGCASNAELQAIDLLRDNFDVEVDNADLDTRAELEAS